MAAAPTVACGTVQPLGALGPRTCSRPVAPARRTSALPPRPRCAPLAALCRTLAALGPQYALDEKCDTTNLPAKDPARFMAQAFADGRCLMTVALGDVFKVGLAGAWRWRWGRVGEGVRGRMPAHQCGAAVSPKAPASCVNGTPAACPWTCRGDAGAAAFCKRALRVRQCRGLRPPGDGTTSPARCACARAGVQCVALPGQPRRGADARVLQSPQPHLQHARCLLQHHLPARHARAAHTLALARRRARPPQPRAVCGGRRLGGGRECALAARVPRVVAALPRKPQPPRSQLGPGTRPRLS
jgi:hypothetical protein